MKPIQRNITLYYDRCQTKQSSLITSSHFVHSFVNNIRFYLVWHTNSHSFYLYLYFMYSHTWYFATTTKWQQKRRNKFINIRIHSCHHTHMYRAWSPIHSYMCACAQTIAIINCDYQVNLIFRCPFPAIYSSDTSQCDSFSHL